MVIAAFVISIVALVIAVISFLGIKCPLLPEKKRSSR